MSYYDNVKNFVKIDSKDVNFLNENAFIYFGRSSCPYCQEFSNEFPRLKQKVYYVDTQNRMDTNLQSVRNQFNIQTVPSVIYRKPNGVYTKLNRDIRQSFENFILMQK